VFIVFTSLDFILVKNGDCLAVTFASQTIKPMEIFGGFLGCQFEVVMFSARFAIDDLN